jgi:hypothetical protein
MYGSWMQHALLPNGYCVWAEYCASAFSETGADLHLLTFPPIGTQWAAEQCPQAVFE